MLKTAKGCFGSVEDPKHKTLVIGLGAMKCGTSWLSRSLGELPGFLHSPTKEMNVFNQFFENPFRGRQNEFRLMRFEEIILGSSSLTHPRNLDRLRSLAQIGRIDGPDAYLAYFAERLRKDHTHFGEISPSYSHLSADALREISTLTQDVRLLFLVRDPAKRAASHIRHVRRRLRANEPIDAIIDEITPSHPIWMRSDYGFTLDRLAEAGLEVKSRCLVFEALFEEATMKNLCSWLKLSYRPPQIDRKANVGSGEDLTSAQHARLREKLEPLYQDLRRRSLPAGSERWDW